MVCAVLSVILAIAVVAMVVTLIARSVDNKSYRDRIRSRTKHTTSPNSSHKIYKTCPYCHSEVDAAVNFCPHCGAPFGDNGDNKT